MFKKLIPAASFFGLLTLIVSEALAALHYMLGDELLFHTDFYSLWIYLGGMGTCLAVLIGLPMVLAMAAFPQRRTWFYELFLVLGVCVLLAVPIFLYCEQRWPILLSAGLASLLVLVLGGIVFRSEGRPDVVGRVEHIGLAACVLLTLAVPPAIGWNHLANDFQSDVEKGKHLVVIVVDGLPTQHLPAYRAEASPTAMDQLMRESILFEQMRTTFPYTNGFFGVLYTGKTNLDSKDEAIVAQRCGANLMDQLQRHGVSSQWIVFHRNGMPEGCRARCDNYRGLRSYLLTENYVWIPRVLGLEYHVSLGLGPMMRNLRGPHARRLFYWMNRSTIEAPHNMLTGMLMSQLKERRKRCGKSFTVLHTDVRYTAGDPGDLQESNWMEQDWDADPVAHPKKLKKNARTDWQVVGARAKEILQPLDQRLQKSVQQSARDLRDFFRKAREEGLLEDTTFIVTADHGLIFDKGRMWKTYHPNPEVVRVPLFLIDGQTVRRDQRLVSTPDLRQTILEWFDIESSHSSEAGSILSGDENSYTATLTLPSSDVPEWFLVVAMKGKVYRSNIHACGDGTTVVMEWNDYDERPLSQQTGPPPEIQAILPQIRQYFDLPPKLVHADYH